MIRALLIVSLCWAAVSRTAQAQASPYLPLDHPAYAMVDALMARGELAGLWRLERPYRVQDIREALDAPDQPVANAVVASWRAAVVRGLDIEFGAVRAPDAEPEALVNLEAFVTAQSSGQRELMLADTVSGAYPGLGGRAIVAAGPFIATGRLALDRRLKDDPDFVGKKDRGMIGRNLEGYFSAQFRYGELFFGRTARSWGPGRVRGLQLGDAPDAYEHVYGRIGSSRLRLSAMLARLDDWRYGADSIANRFFAIHRIAVRIGPLEIGGTESMLYGGRGRGLELAYANPLSVYSITQYNENQQGNVNVGLDASLQTRRFGTIGIQGMLDDLQVDECGANCEEPPSYGVTLTWDGLPLGRGQTAFATYTRLTNLAYRTPAPHEQYAFLGIGLGHAFTDYDEMRLGAELALLGNVVLKPYVARRRQGEGSFRAPFPLPADYATTPGFLAGTVMRTTRIALAGTSLALGRLSVDTDVGLNRVTNARHVARDVTAEFEGRVIARMLLAGFRW